jgi:predicted TIM-barrel fold metal-dependent hydrolase
MGPCQRPIGRRRFLGSLALGTVLANAKQEAAFAFAAPPDQPPLVIDSHAHIYGEDETTYPTIEKPNRPPAGTGTVAHLLRTMRASGVRQATAIQTTTFYRFDNRFLADSARLHRDVMVGVCTLNPDDPASPALVERLVRDSNVRGLRSIPARSGRLDDPGVNALWAAAARLGIVVNVLVNRDQSNAIETMARRYPSLRVVIDHCLNLKAGPGLEATLHALERLAQVPNLHAKLTFIPTGSAQAYPCADLHDACRRVIAAFSPARCVWGSNFPCELWCPKITYAQHLAIFTRELGLDAPAQAAMLGETAHRLWFQPLT